MGDNQIEKLVHESNDLSRSIRTASRELLHSLKDDDWLRAYALAEMIFSDACKVKMNAMRIAKDAHNSG